MKRIIVQFFEVLIGWSILVPLSYIIPKKNISVFIPRFANSFDGNLKYLFIYLNSLPQNDIQFFFLTENKKVYNDIKVAGLPVLFYPCLSGFFQLLQAKIIIVDSNEWIGKLKYYTAFNTYKIQLWHGSGMKTVGMQKHHVINRNFLLDIAAKLLGHHPLYDLLVLNSTLQQETRAKAFRYRKIIINGQPRNDIFFKNYTAPFLTGIDENIYKKCVHYKNDGYKIVAYCPTHRKSSKAFLSVKNLLDIERLNKFAVDNKIIFVFKYHPKTLKEHQYDLSETSNIFEYDKTADIYPLLTKCDLMITDYSSIFVDFIIQNKPVIFIPFDYDHYIKEERALQFNYSEVTPGKKCFTYTELEDELKKIIVDGIDNYKENRKEILKKFFDVIDGNSCNRIWDYLQTTK